jgi:hypothetical protein
MAVGIPIGSGEAEDDAGVPPISSSYSPPLGRTKQEHIMAASRLLYER